MGLSEPYRCIVSGHWRLITWFVLLPIAAVAALGSTASTKFVATARIQASSATLGSDTEADSLLNRVKGVATSTSVVAQAMRTAHISGRDAAEVAGEVSVTRLGSSTVMDISVTDRRQGVARDLAGVLATRVVEFMGGQGSSALQKLVSSLNAEQQRLLARRQKIVATLSAPAKSTDTPVLSAQLSNIDQQTADIAATLRQVQVTLATGSSASVISTPATAKPATDSPTVRLVLVGIAGLAAGLLVAALLEMLRPRLADAHAVARELEAPVLGSLSDERGPAGPGSARRWWARPSAAGAAGPESDLAAIAIRRAAVSAQLRHVALIGASTGADLVELAEVLDAKQATTARPAPTEARPNGRSSATTMPSESRPHRGGSRQTATATAVKPLAQAAPWRPVRVVAVTEAGGRSDDELLGLLVVAHDLTPMKAVRRVRDLSVATGWPVIGVLDAGRRQRASLR